ncbi:MAG: EAL domain-containing protein [Lachnospiraceae bacterium]|jgi:diguanylate cyclase (GGDEF)-like protein|nr:EAL domain-containing protein [Lachnospiraceae bacterium]
MTVKKHTLSELTIIMSQMTELYDYVSVINPDRNEEWHINDNREIETEIFGCHIWDGGEDNRNMDVAAACVKGKRIERVMEYDGNTYHILMVPVDYVSDTETVRCVLECVTRIEGVDYNAEENTKRGSAKRSIKDPLTGLYNWDGFFEKARETMDEQWDKEWVIIAYDIMSFKLVNDLFGEEKGDEVLKAVGNLIKSKCAPDEVCARLRGDLYAVCIHKENFDNSFIISASKELPGIIDSPQFHLHIQGGVYVVTDRSLMVSAMVDRAQLALSTIKGSSEQRLVEFDENLMEKVLKEQQIITDFRRALVDGEFHMFLQPQVSHRGIVKGAEALIRWIRKTGEIVAPGEFLDVLERTDLITDLDKFIWEEAAKTLASWKGTDKEDLYISVNISPKDFFYMDVYTFMTDLVEKYGINKKKLKLEITETILMQDALKQLALVNRLHDEGFDIEIDDFGKGYSSLSLLKDINADVLKIDKEFLQETENSKRSEDILGTVIDMSDRLSMRVITEGVETKKQLDKMIELGCYMFQGFYFARPMSIIEFERRWDNLGAEV